MSHDMTLQEQRERLKLALSRGSYKTLVDILLGWANYPLRRIRRVNDSITIIWGTLVIFLLTLAVGLLAVVLAGETSILKLVTQKYGFWWMMVFFLACPASMIGVNVFIHQLVGIVREEVLDVVDSLETLSDIEKWFAVICNKKLALWIDLLGGVLAGVYLVILVNALLGSSVGWGVATLCILFSLQSTVFVGFLWLILSFATRMRRYDLLLFPVDPANSQVVHNVSGFFVSVVYSFAIYGALLTYIVFTVGAVAFSILLPQLFWSLIVLIFAAYHYGLAQIIQRSKWKTLKIIQQQVQTIQDNHSIPDKEAREMLDWLFVQHDRVKATRNSALNFEAGFNLFNSLLLPVLAFILGNLDKIIALFR